MDNKTAAISNENNRIALCIFTGSKYMFHPTFYDNFSLTQALKILEHYDCPLIVSVSEIFQEAFRTRSSKNIIYTCRKSRGTTLPTLGRLENSLIRLLAAYLKHMPLVSVDSESLIGYAGEYPVERMQPAGFFMDDYIITNMCAFSNLELLKRNTLTSFGRHHMYMLISEPLTFKEAILDRRLTLEYMACKIPKIQKLLKRCRVNCFNKELDLFRLRQLVKSALGIHKLLHEKIRLENNGKYLRLYRVLRIFNRDGVLRGKDSKLDEYWNSVNKIPAILETVARRLANKYQVPLGCVYIPGAGFFIESSHSIHEPVFRIKDKLYMKCEEMINLDNRFQDPYEQINERETEIVASIIQKIRKMRLSYLYDFIGVVDSYVSLYLTVGGEFSDILEAADSFRCGNTRFSKRSIFLGELDVNSVAETIILNQIGSRVPGTVEKLPIFKRLIVKPRSRDDKHNSTFQNEVIQLSRVYRTSTEDTFTILDGIAESTAPAAGVQIFSELWKKISAKYLIACTSYDYSDLRILPVVRNACFYRIRDGMQEDATEDVSGECGLCNEFLEYIRMWTAEHGDVAR